MWGWITHLCFSRPSLASLSIPTFSYSSLISQLPADSPLSSHASPRISHPSMPPSASLNITLPPHFFHPSLSHLPPSCSLSISQPLQLFLSSLASSISHPPIPLLAPPSISQLPQFHPSLHFSASSILLCLFQLLLASPSSSPPPQPLPASQRLGGPVCAAVRHNNEWGVRPPVASSPRPLAGLVSTLWMRHCHASRCGGLYRAAGGWKGLQRREERCLRLYELVRDIPTFPLPLCWLYVFQVKEEGNVLSRM